MPSEKLGDEKREVTFRSLVRQADVRDVSAIIDHRDTLAPHLGHEPSRVGDLACEIRPLLREISIRLWLESLIIEYGIVEQRADQARPEPAGASLARIRRRLVNDEREPPRKVCFFDGGWGTANIEDRGERRPIDVVQHVTTVIEVLLLRSVDANQDLQIE